MVQHMITMVYQLHNGMNSRGLNLKASTSMTISRDSIPVLRDLFKERGLIYTIE